MGDARSVDDRLPWLDPPRPAKPVPASTRARTPLLVLIGLFLTGAIAMMAFLTGRGTAPDAPPAPTATQPPPTPKDPVPVPAPAPIPLPAAPLSPPAPVAATPTRAAPAEVQAKRPKTTRTASVRRAPTKPKTRRPSPPVVARAVETPRPALRAVAVVPQRRTIWPARPFAGPRGRVIQLGAYLTPAQADAGWWRVARVYPYLATLPRVVTAPGPSRGRARYYRVRLAAGSGREARALCNNLHRIGRGCIVV